MSQRVEAGGVGGTSGGGPAIYSYHACTHGPVQSPRCALCP